MPLIKCPMCEKDISPNAKACPHCGEPIKETLQSVEEINNEKKVISNLDFIIKVNGEIYITEREAYEETIAFLCREYIVFTDANEEKILLMFIYDSLKNLDILRPFPKKKGGIFKDVSRMLFLNKSTKEQSPEFRITNNDESDRFLNESLHIIMNINQFSNMSFSSNIKCPTCSSKNVIKISLANKTGSALVFGVFALGHISKTFKCNDCGYKW